MVPVQDAIDSCCTAKNWQVKDNPNAGNLINACFENKIIPEYLQKEFSSLRTLLESGIAPIRNKLGGHGQGETPITVEDEITRYALNLTGSNIIFLVEQSGL